LTLRTRAADGRRPTRAADQGIENAGTIAAVLDAFVIALHIDPGEKK
jgi:hypothetical protein